MVDKMNGWADAKKTYGSVELLSSADAPYKWCAPHYRLGIEPREKQLFREVQRATRLCMHESRRFELKNLQSSVCSSKYKLRLITPQILL